MDFLDTLIYEAAGTGKLGKFLICIETLLVVVALTIAVYALIRIVLHLIRTKSKIDITRHIAKCLLKRNASEKISVLMFFFFLMNMSSRLFNLAKIVGTVSEYAMVVCFMVIIGTALDIVNDAYTTKEISKRKPIKGPLQIVKFLIYTVMVIIMISMLLNQNPIVLISGIGTFTAILSIVFKDALLGLVAGVQITSDNLLQIDDWISIPSIGVEGSVKDISLVTVKVKTFDNTIMSVPAYTFVSVPFKNYHHTISDSERQINKVIAIDVNTVRKVDEFESGEIIRKHKNAFEGHPVEGGLTNLYYYRNYLEYKLHSDEHIKEDFNIVCRVNESKGSGVILEIYATTDVADYEEFTSYGSQIIELAIVAMKDFDLKPYQSMVSK